MQGFKAEEAAVSERDMESDCSMLKTGCWKNSEAVWQRARSGSATIK